MHLQRISLFVLAWPLVGILPAMAADAPATEAEYKAAIEKLMPGMAADKIPDREGPQQALEKLCHEAAAPGREAQRTALCKTLISFAGPDAAKPARIWLLRKIETIGQAEVVADLTGLLSDADKDVRETARRALANNPSQQAAEALRVEAGKAGDAAWRVACINALGWRKDAGSVAVLGKLAAEQDEAIVRAALAALGDVGDSPALKALKEIGPNVPATARATFQDAWLRAVEKLAGEMGPDSIVAGFKDWLAPAQPEHIRIAALTGMARAGAAGAGDILVQHAKGDDAHLRLIAARLLQSMDKPATPLIVDALEGASPESAALLLDVLGERGDTAALKTITLHATHPDKEVRTAAITAIGKLGNESSVDLLLKAAAEGDGDQRDAARTALSVLRGNKVDEVVLKSLAAGQGKLLLESLQAVWGRRIAAAKPTLVKLAVSPEEPVRVAVLNAYERLADETDLPVVVAMLAKATSDAERQAGEQTILSASRRAGDAEACTELLVKALDGADARGQVTLVKALTRLGTPGALSAIRKASRSGAPPVQSAAQAALRDWKAVRVTQWRYAGPFRQDGKGAQELFDIAFEPEKEQTGGSFKPLRNATRDDGILDLSRIPGVTDNCCAYVRATIQSATEQAAILSLGSDDGIKVWLNGEQVHAKNALRPTKCDEEQAEIKFKAGANTLLIKVTQGGADFSLCASIKAPDGGPPEGLTFESR